MARISGWARRESSEARREEEAVEGGELLLREKEEGSKLVFPFVEFRTLLSRAGAFDYL